MLASSLMLCPQKLHRPVYRTCIEHLFLFPSWERLRIFNEKFTFILCCICRVLAVSDQCPLIIIIAMECTRFKWGYELSLSEALCIFTACACEQTINIHDVMHSTCIQNFALVSNDWSQINPYMHWGLHCMCPRIEEHLSEKILYLVKCLSVDAYHRHMVVCQSMCLCVCLSARCSGSVIELGIQYTCNLMHIAAYGHDTHLTASHVHICHKFYPEAL